MPAIEGVATLGLAAAADLNSAHEFEERMWEQIPYKIDPTLKICQLDGLLFNSDQELQSHIKMHVQQQQGYQSSMMNSMLMMDMMGGITGALENKARTPSEVPRFVPTTKKGSRCGAMIEIELGDSTYECIHCRLVIDRDLNGCHNHRKGSIRSTYGA